MIKEIEAEEITDFLSAFCHWLHFNLGVHGPPGYACGISNNFDYITLFGSGGCEYLQKAFSTTKCNDFFNH